MREIDRRLPCPERRPFRCGAAPIADRRWMSRSAFADPAALRGSAPESYPSHTHAGAVRSIAAAPGRDPVIEPQGDLPELVECFRARDQADAALMAQYLEERGIATHLTLEHQAFANQLGYVR